jgi:hypothetical protein
MLGIELGEVGYEVLHHRHMGQGIDPDRPPDVTDRLEAGKRVGAVDIHRAGAADTFPAGAAKRQGGILLALDLDERIEHHRAA